MNRTVYHFLFINIGNTYLNLKAYNKAKEYFEEGLSIANSNNINQEKTESYLALAKLYKTRNNYEKAIKYYDAALNIAKKTNLVFLQKEATSELHNIYYELNNYWQAFNYLKLSIAFSDSLNKIKEADNLAKLETRFEFENLQQQKEIEQARANEEIKKQVLLRNSFIVGSLLMTILGLIIFYNYRRKKKDNKTLLWQKRKIEEMSKKVYEADQSKLRFFTNISQELRAPLTLVLGMTDKLHDTFQDNKHLSTIKKNMLKLVRLVNQ
jgi:tetratricopeptide (TPR) repeat protein